MGLRFRNLAMKEKFELLQMNSTGRKRPLMSDRYRPEAAIRERLGNKGRFS